MDAELHRLLSRQLRRLGHGVAPDALSGAPLAALLKAVSQAYSEFERNHYLLDRSLGIAAEEQGTLNKELERHRAQLRRLLALSSDWVWEMNHLGRFTQVSEDVEERVGVHFSSILGQRLATTGLLVSDAAQIRALAQHLATRTAFRDITFSVVDRAGNTRYMKITGEPVEGGGQRISFRGVADDVTSAVEAERRAQDAARRAVEAQLAFASRLLDVNPTPMFVKDTEDRFTMVNPAWLALIGLPADMVIGRTSAQWFDADSPWLATDDTEALRLHGRSQREVRFARPDGQVRDVMITKVSFVVANEQPGGIIGSIVDVTEFKEAQRVTQAAKVVAEEANRAKEEFIANVSHELRTPLQSIIGFSELGVTRTRDQPRWNDMFQSIHNAGGRMLTLVNALLDLSKASDIHTALEIRTRDLQPLVAEVCDELWPLTQNRGVAISVGLQPGQLHAAVDAFRIQQVLRNVIANALRFSPSPGLIDIEGGTTDEGGSFVAIRDHGPGIPPAELDAIFEPFVQSSRTRDGSGGTGLGLTISRKIMDVHGGRISAANADGGGARIVLVFPPTPA
jgi:PAS domain S-box-containing protein